MTLTFAWRRIAKHALSAVSVTANLTEKERKDYSLCKLILHGAEPQRYEAGLETEISRSIEARIGKATSGFYVPTRLRPEATGLDTKTNAAGAYPAGR